MLSKEKYKYHVKRTERSMIDDRCHWQRENAKSPRTPHALVCRVCTWHLIVVLAMCTWYVCVCLEAFDDGAFVLSIGTGTGCAGCRWAGKAVYTTISSVEHVAEVTANRTLFLVTSATRIFQTKNSNGLDGGPSQGLVSVVLGKIQMNW